MGERGKPVRLYSYLNFKVIIVLSAMKNIDRKSIQSQLIVGVLLLFSTLAASCGLGDASLVETTPTPISIETVVEPIDTDQENSPVESAPATCRDEELLCVGLVSDVGGIDDKAFNQAAWDGVKQAQRDLAAQVDFKVSADPSEYYPLIRGYAEEEYDVIVTVGFSMASATNILATEYPDVDFIGVDQVQSLPLDNVAGLVFSEKKAGFLAGALAALASKSGKIGAVLGPDIVPPIVAFKEGYEVGAYAINQDIEVTAVFHPGSLVVAFNDPEWAGQTAMDMIDSGVDVVFGAGGPTGNGALVAVAENSDAICIGVDTDQWFTVPDAQPCLITSAVKEIADGVFELIAWSLLDEFPNGDYAGDVALAPFHEFDESVPADAQAFLSDLKDDLLNGVVPTDGSYVFSSTPKINVER